MDRCEVEGEFDLCTSLCDEDSSFSSAGRVVSPPSGDYHIVPLELTEPYTEQVPAVTLIWLVRWISESWNKVSTITSSPQQRCLEAGRLLDPSSYFLFQPMTTPINDSTLTGCVLAFR